MRLDGGTVWLTQRLLAELFQVSVPSELERIRDIRASENPRSRRTTARSRPASLFQRACELGSGQGCLNLSDAYAKGQGVSRDPSNAFTSAVRGCSLREQTACIRVASAKLVGDGVAKDVGGALAQLDASCTARQAAACSMLSNLYTRGLGADVVANADRAHAYAAKGCSLGDAPSCAAARR